MNHNDFDFELLTNKQLLELQKENPNTIIIPMNTIQREELKEISKQRREDEEKYPILKRTPESLAAPRLMREFDRQKSEYVEKLENIPLQAMLTCWLNDFGDENKQTNTKNVVDLQHKGVFPMLNSQGTVFTVGDFKLIKHKKTIAYIKNIEILTKAKRALMIQCYRAFLRYLKSISKGSFRGEEPLIIPHLQLSTVKPDVTKWFDQAREDFNTSQDLSLSHPLAYGNALYFLQQAAEKALKALLLFHTNISTKSKDFTIHDLDALLKRSIPYDGKLDEFQPFMIKLSPYSEKTRYPDPEKKFEFIKFDLVEEHMENVYSLLIYIQDLMQV